MRSPNIRLVFIGVTTICAACRIAPEVRRAANLTSVYTATVQQELERFARQRDAIAQARVRNAGMLEASALAAEQMGATDINGWRLAGDAPRIALYDGILTATNQAAQGRRETAAQRAAYTRAADAARGGVVVRSADLAHAAQSLATLAKNPDAKSELEFYVSFFQQVRKDLDSLQAAAKKDAAKAVAASASANKSTAPIP